MKSSSLLLPFLALGFAACATTPPPAAPAAIGSAQPAPAAPRPAAPTNAAASATSLRSWRTGANRAAIIDFVTRVTTPGSPDFVPVPERIAVFDNDGTLWAEQPMSVQVQFALDRVFELAPDHPEWRTQEPMASILRGDAKGVVASGEAGILKLIAETHTGMTVQEFNQSVATWISANRHPTSGLPYTQMVYKPMLELLAYLRANGFKTYIVTVAGVEFIRPWAEQVYGIPPEQIIGSYGKLSYEVVNGKPALRKLPELGLLDTKTGKPVAIQTFIGRRPILAVGNSDGDLSMLQWTAAGPGARLALLVHHDDPKREWAYDRYSRVGTLDEALDAAAAKGWTVVSMRTDWISVFPDAPVRYTPPVFK